MRLIIDANKDWPDCRNNQTISFTATLKAMQQTDLFSDQKLPTSTREMLIPATYTGLAGFHKYWGKKP
jgi:hypothetical protein